MPAHKGNTYAEKWTREKVLKELDAIKKEAQKQTCLWLGSALVKRSLYREIWSYWCEKFKDDREVFQTIKGIEQIFEDRLFSKALRGDVDKTVAIFGLKNNHVWSDRKEIDHTTKGEAIRDINVNVINRTDPVTSENDINEDI